MAIPSINEEQISPDFFALLEHYPGLARWLSEIIRHREELQADTLLPSFLNKCVEHDVPGDAYPFTSKDRGLIDLHIYLSQALEDVTEKVAAVTRIARADNHEKPASTGKENLTDGLLGVALVERDEAKNDQPIVRPEEREGRQESEVTTLSAKEADHTDQVTGPMSRVAKGIVSEPEEAVSGSISSDASKKELGRLRVHAGGRCTLPRWPVRQRIVVWTLLLLIVGAILVPAGFLITFGISAYSVYHGLSDEAHSAVGHLLNVRTILTGGRSALTVAKLRQVENEFAASGRDFQQIHTELENSATLKRVVTYFPGYQSTLTSAKAASVIGIDIGQIGQIVTARVIQFVSTWTGSLLSVSNEPLVTQPMLDAIGTTLDQVLPLLSNIQANAQGISLSSLPLSAQEKAEIEPLLQQLPLIVLDLGLARNLLGVASWLLGVDHPRTFLVQTMDRAELRGTGGFTGQYGELTINGGRVAPFSLKDISQLEYVAGSANQGQTAPEQYVSWWPFANWGLRDSNISADFPTAAKLAVSLYKQEAGDQVEGVISFTPVLIEHLLAIIGPIEVPDYNVTVTAQNLEDTLHYYQLDNSGISKQMATQPGDTATSSRKRFTNYLATLFLQKVRVSSPTELLAIAGQVFLDLKTRDLQVYFTDSAAESALEEYGYAGQMDRSSTHDGLYVVQENLSASKASQYVQTIIHDTVALDSKGGATHLLQLRLVYNQAGPVYGYDAYYDYLRVYVPPNSRLLSGDGFSTGNDLCGGYSGDCPVHGVYPGGELTCPTGQYQPGSAPPWLTGSNGAAWEPLQTIGEPTNTTSDEPGRAMYGGWVIVPKNCTMNVTLSWYVPPLLQHPYTLLVQRQAGTFPELDMTILPNSANCVQLRTAGLHFDHTLTQDVSFTMPTYDPKESEERSCYPQSSV